MKAASLVTRAILSFHRFGQAIWQSLFSGGWFNFVCVWDTAGELGCGAEQTCSCLQNTNLIMKSVVSSSLSSFMCTNIACDSIVLP